MHTADAHLEVRVAGEGRTARRRRVVRQATLGTRRRAAAAADRLRPHDQRVLPRQSGGGDRVDRRSVRRAGTGRLAEPPQGVRLPPEGRRAAKSRARERFCRRSRARLSAAGDRARRPDAARFLPRRAAAEGGASMPASSAGSSASSPPRASSSASSASRRASPPARRIGSSDLDLASRLSFFLWSSIPDDELLDAAVRGNAERSGRARAAGPAHARRSAVERAGRQLRRRSGSS